MKKTVLWLVPVLVLLTQQVCYAGIFEKLMMPGELVTAHKKYEQDCDQCHVSFEKHSQKQKCRQCHEEIDMDITKQTGLHGKSPRVRNAECQDCHTDHRGREADIVKLDRSTFDHEITDFPLQGKHQLATCNACHDENRKFRDTSSRCYACHRSQDVHQGKLGQKCQRCHTAGGWKKSGFDHDKTAFSLNGRHAVIACNDCHINQRYRNTPKQCVKCHITRDVHNGRMGDRCEKCHTSRKWSVSKFDHDRDTKYRLVGGHRTLSCHACHRDNPYAHSTPVECYGCHKKDDAHRQVFGQRCQQCHSPVSWAQARFDHDRKTGFPLRHRHSKLRCLACHQQKSAATGKARQCVDCHKLDDVHRGSQGLECQQCHNDAGWRDRVVFDHDLSRFPLIGLHASVACEECHLSSDYSQAEASCSSCHANQDSHRGAFGKRCEQCHNPNAWSRWQFDHDISTDFRLTGKHHGLHCHACHTPGQVVDSLSTVCSACHARDDIHDGQFGLMCDQCHVTEDFRDIRMMERGF